MKIRVAIFIFIYSLSAQTGVLIGNGGGGVRIGNKVFLSDTFHLPYIRTEFGIEIPRSLVGELENKEFLIEKLKVDKERFASSLARLESLFPGLGILVLEILDRTNILFVSQELPLVKHSIGSNTRRNVQVAIRHLDAIYISQPTYDLMDADNKILLWIHEALFFIVRPSCNDDICYQQATAVENIVRLIFDPFNLDRKLFRAKLINLINLPDSSYICEQPHITLQIFDHKSEILLSESYSRTASIPTSKILNLCAQNEMIFSISARIIQFTLDPFIFVNNEYSQKAYQLNSHLVGIKRTIDPKLPSCRINITNFLENILGKNSQNEFVFNLMCNSKKNNFNLIPILELNFGR